MMGGGGGIGGSTAGRRHTSTLVSPCYGSKSKTTFFTAALPVKEVIRDKTTARGTPECARQEARSFAQSAREEEEGAAVAAMRGSRRKLAV